MRRAPIRPTAAFAVALTLLVLHTAFAADKAEPGSCNITTGGIGSGGNIVTCNFGMSPDQLKATIEAAVKGGLIDRIVDISKTLGVTEDAAKNLLRIVGEDANIPEDKLAEALTKVAGDYKRLQVQVAALNPDNPTAKALVEQAKPEIEAGHFQRAHDLLRQATQVQIAAAREARKLREQAQAAEDAQMLGAANSTAAEGDLALTERRYSDAAERFGEAAAYVPKDHASERGGYLRRQGDALSRQGDERGDNAALQMAIKVYGNALSEFPRSQVPLDWATTQNNLGIALKTLGERESGTASLEAAVTAYRAALEERTRERAPLDWAQTQNNLGNALLGLGERESGTASLEAAVTAFRAALEEYTGERAPLDWAMTQNNLGAALLRLGERESGTASLEAAVTACRAALEEQTRERAPLQWAATQNNLGSALRTLGERESGTASLEAAVTAYRAALEEYTRERVPLDWAGTQNNLGAALTRLGERESGTASLEAAVTAYRAALEERTRERVPLDWAATQNNLGSALKTLGERESGTASLEAAVTAFRAALEEYTRERAPLQWAGTQNNLGNALFRLGERESGTASLEAAVTAYRAALEERTRERFPLDWAMTQNNLGAALTRLGERESGTGRLEQAVAAYRAALEEWTKEASPYWHNVAENNLAGGLRLLEMRRNPPPAQAGSHENAKRFSICDCLAIDLPRAAFGGNPLEELGAPAWQARAARRAEADKPPEPKGASLRLAPRLDLHQAQDDVAVAFAWPAHGAQTLGYGRFDPDHALALRVRLTLEADGAERQRGGDRLEGGGAFDRSLGARHSRSRSGSDGWSKGWSDRQPLLENCRLTVISRGCFVSTAPSVLVRCASALRRVGRSRPDHAPRGRRQGDPAKRLRRMP